MTDSALLYQPCRHGAQPIVETYPVPRGSAGPFEKYLPGRAEFLGYDCPTPSDCWVAEIARQKASA